MRLMGLPKVGNYPEATVTRHEEYIGLVFGGKGNEQAMNVPLKYVGGDAESAELWLLADLERMGYRVCRGDPSENDGRTTV
ncbi:MAG: hypothetical protein ACR2KW_00835 [Rubrobacter sp.]